MKEITASVKKTLVVDQSRKHLGCVSDVNPSLQHGSFIDLDNLQTLQFLLHSASMKVHFILYGEIM